MLINLTPVNPLLGGELRLTLSDMHLSLVICEMSESFAYISRPY